jgi:hypothetical protein
MKQLANRNDSILNGFHVRSVIFYFENYIEKLKAADAKKSSRGKVNRKTSHIDRNNMATNTNVAIATMELALQKRHLWDLP